MNFMNWFSYLANNGEVTENRDEIQSPFVHYGEQPRAETDNHPLHQAFRPQVTNPALTLTSPAGLDTSNNFSPVLTPLNFTYLTQPNHRPSTSHMASTSNPNSIMNRDHTSDFAGPFSLPPSRPDEDGASAIGAATARFISSMNRQLQDYLNGNPSYEDLDVAMRASMRVSDNILKRIKEVGGDVEDTVMDEGTAHEANDEDGEGPGGEEDGVDDEDNEEEKEDDDDDMDFASILTEATLNRIYDQPYNSRWMIDHGVPTNRYAEFQTKYYCSHRLDGLVRVGAIAVGDELAVQMAGALGPVQWRFARVTQAGVKTPGQPLSLWWPHVALLQAKGGQPMTQPTAYATPDLIIKAFEDVFQGTALGKGYGGVHVWRGLHDLGTIADVRMTWGLWQKILDLWTEANGKRWRIRNKDPKTGTYYQKTAIIKRKK